MNILVAVIMIGVLVFAHEMGHFWAAKASGIMVLEFAVGMGPTLISRQVGETRYSLRLLPIGGFARMAGEEVDEANNLIPDDRRYDKKPLYARAFVSVAGPLTNFLLAILIFAVVFMFVGVPSGQPVVGSLAEGWPAAQAGMAVGDRITSIAGKPVDSWEDIQGLVGDLDGQNAVIEVERAGQTLRLQMVPQTNAETGQVLIGIGPRYDRFSFLGSVKLGLQEMVWFTNQIVSILGNMVTGKIPAEGAGPIGMIVMVGEVASTGLANLFTFAGIISIQLGLFNLLPIPALDGSRLIFFAIEAVRGRPVDPEKENFVHFLGFIMLMVFMVLVTFQDLRRLNIF